MDASEKQARIDAAIKAHFGWLERLKRAIVTGASEISAEAAASDETCELSIWMKANMKELCPKPKICEEIRAVHAAFHKKAAAVLALALRGDKDAASREVVPGAELYALSGRLVILLREI